ncbi:MAG: hypothetical protein V4697_01800 [Patescibacteria group bacterium]
MIPYHSGYLDSMANEDTKLLVELSLTSLFATKIYLNHFHQIREHFKASSTWCHLTARVVADVFSDYSLTVVDGCVYDIECEIQKEATPCLTHTWHSWCKTRNGSILDAAPVGALSFMPVLYAKEKGVRIPRCTYVNNRYHETGAGKEELQKALLSEKYQKAYAPYVNLLRQARTEAKQWEWKEKTLVHAP